MTAYTVASLIALIAYSLLMIYVGVIKAYDRKVVTTSRGFFIGGGTGYFVLFFTTAATWFSTWIYMGAPGSFYKNGIGWIAGATWQLLIMFLMGVFGTRFWRMSKSYNYVTPGELIGGYYHSPGLQKTFSMGQLIFCFPYIMAQVSGVGLAVSTLTNGVIPFWVGCIYASAIVGLYVTLGGFKSQAWVDTMQGIMFTVILWITVIIMIYQNGGGIAGLFNGVEAAGNKLLNYVTGDDGYWTWKMYFSYFLIQAIGGYFAPYVWQRSYAAKSGKTILKISGTLGAFYCFAIMLPVCLVGFGGVALGVETTNADNIMVTTMTQYAPYFAIFVVVGILAAGMSTISSILVCASSLVTMDWVLPIKSDIEDSKRQKMIRWITILILVLATILAMSQFQGIVILVNTALAGFMQALWGAFGCFFWKRATKWGVGVGFVSGIVTVVILTATGISLLGFAPGFWGFMVNTVLFFVVSLCTKPIPEEERKKWLEPLRKTSTLR